MGAKTIGDVLALPANGKLGGVVCDDDLDEIFSEVLFTDCWSGCCNASDYYQPVGTAVIKSVVVQIVIADDTPEFPVRW